MLRAKADTICPRGCGAEEERCEWEDCTFRDWLFALGPPSLEVQKHTKKSFNEMVFLTFIRTLQNKIKQESNSHLGYNYSSMLYIGTTAHIYQLFIGTKLQCSLMTNILFIGIKFIKCGQISCILSKALNSTGL